MKRSAGKVSSPLRRFVFFLSFVVIIQKREREKFVLSVSRVPYGMKCGGEVKGVSLSLLLARVKHESPMWTQPYALWLGRVWTGVAPPKGLIPWLRLMSPHIIQGRRCVLLPLPSPPPLSSSSAALVTAWMHRYYQQKGEEQQVRWTFARVIFSFFTLTSMDGGKWGERERERESHELVLMHVMWSCLNDILKIPFRVELYHLNPGYSWEMTCLLFFIHCAHVT